jgi:PAS domain S-box-containing protein
MSADPQNRPVEISTHIDDYREMIRRISELELFRAIMDRCCDAIFIVDQTDGRITDVSGCTIRRLGYSRKALLGMTLADLVDDEARRTISSMAVDGPPPCEIVATLHGKDGLRVPCLIMASVVRVDGTPMVGVIARETTGRKQIHEPGQTEEQLRAALHEKEIMLKEIHHRVKNNLQVISSLLSIQSQYLADSRDLELFRRSQDRVRSMALVHEQLYRTNDLAVIDFSIYIDTLVHNLLASYRGEAGNVKVNVDAAGVFLGIDAALPCGLIVNELVSNALKHAFPGGMAGQLTVRMRECEGTYVLEVSDDGAGLAHPLEVEKSHSMGLQLVTLLTGQLDGTLTVDTSHGTKFRITFKDI